MKNVERINDEIETSLQTNSFKDFSTKFLRANFKKTYISIRNCNNFFPLIQQKILELKQFYSNNHSALNGMQKNELTEEIKELKNMQNRCRSYFVETVKSCRKWVPHFILKLNGLGLNDERNQVQQNLT